MAVAEDGDDLVRLRYDGKVIGSAPHFGTGAIFGTPENSALGRKGFGLDYAATVGARSICRTSIEVFLSGPTRPDAGNFDDDLKCVQTS